MIDMYNYWEGLGVDPRATKGYAVIPEERLKAMLLMKTWKNEHDRHEASFEAKKAKAKANREKGAR